MDTRPTTGGHGGARSLRERLRAALPEAMKARDAVAVAALRSALAAIDNAEAVGAGPARPGAAAAPGVGSADVAGAVLGVGAAEVERRSLTEAQVEELVRAEVADRQAAARQYEQAGHHQRAERLGGEAGVLGAYLDGAGVSRSGPGTSGRGGGTGTGR